MCVNPSIQRCATFQSLVCSVHLQTYTPHGGAWHHKSHGLHTFSDNERFKSLGFSRMLLEKAGTSLRSLKISCECWITSPNSTMHAAKRRTRFGDISYGYLRKHDTQSHTTIGIGKPSRYVFLCTCFAFIAPRTVGPVLKKGL